MEPNLKLKKTNKVLKIIFYILYSLITFFIVFSLINAKLEEDPSTNIGYAFTLVIIGIIIGAFAYGALLLLGITDVIIAAVNKTDPKRKKNVLISSISVILPIITYLLIILIGLSGT